MSSANDVEAVIYNFMMAAFRESVGQIAKEEVDQVSAERMQQLLLESDNLTAEEVTMFSTKDKSALYEILSQYICLMELYEIQKIPSGLLHGSNNLQLGKPLLSCIAENPFPLRLPWTARP
jgi:hypothetical protein